MQILQGTALNLPFYLNKSKFSFIQKYNCVIIVITKMRKIVHKLLHYLDGYVGKKSERDRVL